MILKQAEIGPMMNFVYIIGCPETREAAVIDPAWYPQGIMELAKDEDLTIRHILVTHGHPDHVNCMESLQRATNARVYIHHDEIDFLKESGREFGMSATFLDPRAEHLQIVSDGDAISVGNLQIQCLHTPGHSPGSQCFLVEGCLFTGDTLFVDACGRVDFPGSDPAKMWHSLNQKLRGLDDSIMIYPGHDYGGSPTATLGEQKRTNPYMNYDSVKKFVRDMS
jgi:glyoxylase-like metal-dependent hydrolase (beta-lactamase superfamily II)